MERIKGQVLRMLMLISNEEKRRNYETKRVIHRIERILLRADETINAETKFKILSRGN